MDHFAGLDVSVKDTSVCIVDDAGRIVKEVKVASEPEALLKVLGKPAYRFKRIGLEAGPLSQWPISLKRSTPKSSAIHKPGRPITPSLGKTGHSLRPLMPNSAGSGGQENL